MKCNKQHLAIISLAQAAGVFVYNLLLIVFMNGMEDFLTSDDQLIAPFIFLTLFVVSAAITGALVLGKPILLYLDKKRSEAIKLFIMSLAWLLIFVAIAILFMTYL